MSWDPVSAIAAELEALGWTGRDLGTAAAARFGGAPATGEAWWYRARHGACSPQWLDRLLVVLDLHEPPDESSRPGLDAWCPCCREVVATSADGRCSWCSAQTGGNVDPVPGPPRRANAGVPILIDEETMAEARRLYLQGLGFLRVARELHPRTAYSSVRAMAVCLHNAFRFRGWATRDRLEASVGTNTVHGRAPKHGPRVGYKAFLRRRAGLARPRCAGTIIALSGGGRPCRNRAQAGSEFCASHDPARAAERAAHLASVRERTVRARWAA